MSFYRVFRVPCSDLIFAVDSVSAIVAQVNDLFLARLGKRLSLTALRSRYSSAVFAMLGLRATFFIIAFASATWHVQPVQDVLVHMFELLKYGVSAVP